MKNLLNLFFATLFIHYADAATPKQCVEHPFYSVGTQTIGPAYGFKQSEGITVFLETALEIRRMGSRTLKFALDPYAYGIGNQSPHLDLAGRAAWGEFKTALDLDFTDYQLWAKSQYGSWYQNYGGKEITESAKQLEYDAIYKLATYLLRQYSGTGKRFLIGQWEGDWDVMGHTDRFRHPSRVDIKNMIAWLATRQKAVDDAVRDTRNEVSCVYVYHYAEVNLVSKAFDDKSQADAVLTMTNDVLPYVHVDLVSYSAYDAIYWTPEGTLFDNLRRNVSQIESKLKRKKLSQNFPRRVFIGEYGYPDDKFGEWEQDRRSREFNSAALQLGLPYILYWEMYNNEVKEEKHRGFWKVKFYHTIHSYLQAAEEFGRDYTKMTGRPAPFWMIQILSRRYF
jgi:hypothetical protein